MSALTMSAEKAVTDSPTTARHPVVGGIDIAIGVGLLAGIWSLLPARWMPVDLLGTLLALLLIGAGIALCIGVPWARKLGIATSITTLVTGAGLSTALAFTASYLSGLYGPVGRGGALILLVVAVLLVPYLIGLPAIQLHTLLRKPR